MTRSKNGQQATQRVETVPVALLVIDMTLYPRHEVDRYTVNRLVDALAAGETLPAVVADRASKTLIDGVHRVHAVIKHLGAQAEIAVTWQDYANRRAMFEDAVRLNARHGRKLTAWDAVRVARLGEEYGMTTEALASVLAMTTETITALIARRAIDKSNLRTIELKASMSDLSGQELTLQQIDANRHAGGIRPLGCITQVLSFLRAGLYDASRPQTRAKLQELYDELGIVLSEQLAKAA